MLPDFRFAFSLIELGVTKPEVVAAGMPDG